MKIRTHRATCWPFFWPAVSPLVRRLCLLAWLIALAACQASDSTNPAVGNGQSDTAQEVKGMTDKKPAKGTVKPKACPKDAKLCPDGITSVGRDPENNCEFFPCPETGKTGDAPMTDKEKPAANTTEANEKKPFAEQVFCPQDVRQCPDGSWVGRDPNNHCRFRPCPDGSIPGEDGESPLE